MCDATNITMLERIRCCIQSFFFFQAEDGIRDYKVTGVQTCALPIYDFRGGMGVRGVGHPGGREGGHHARRSSRGCNRCRARRTRKENTTMPPASQWAWAYSMADRKSVV